MEGDEVGTTFNNKGFEGRIEFLEKEFGNFRGATGFQYKHRNFEAIGDEAFESETTVLRLPPATMRWYEAVDGALAYKRCRPLLYGWLERAQTRLGSYGPDGAARQRDLEEFEGDFAPLVE